MTSAEASEVRGEVAGPAGFLVVPRIRRRDQYEAVGLLFGILGMLLLVVVTLGATQA